MVRFIEAHIGSCQVSQDGCTDQSLTTVAYKPTKDHRCWYVSIDLYQEMCGKRGQQVKPPPAAWRQQ
jgi:hypothetical protein